MSEKKPETIDDVVERLKKIMRLAKRAGTDGERVAAEAAAKRLADANGITLESIDYQHETAKDVVMDDDRVRYYQGCELGFAIHILIKHFAVHVLFQLNRLGKGHLIWIGNQLNIGVAQYAWDIIIRSCRRHYEHYRKTKVGWDGRREKTHKESFMRGWFLVIDQKLTEHPLRNDTEQFEAEKKSSEDTYKRWRERNRVRDTGRSSKQEDTSSVRAGYEAAQKVNLSRPCESNGRTTGQVGHTLQLEAR